ncbi:hypothetical protein [Nocardia salmonicida]|uniref:hypothetical protein n=1 Tax=Nocardia salmonicida TaxID=53431 RepID=UPI00379DA318
MRVEARRRRSAPPQALLTLYSEFQQQLAKVLRSRTIESMTGLALTEERRAELAALLNDDAKLDAMYPHVADYLDTVMRLPGTGDPDADSSFDLRVVHYLTGGESSSGNPYWDIIEPAITRDRSGRRVVGESARSARLAYAETVLQAAYAYAIPSPETLAWMGAFSEGRTILELGAGRGYWAAQLARLGVPVAAYDSEPPQAAQNPSFPAMPGQQAVWHSVGDLAAYSAADLAESVLFLCWPPGWGTPMASAALAKFMKAGGDRVVFIGEPQGGKTGDDAFFELLADRWALTSEDTEYVAWARNSDVAQGWVLR